MCRPGGPTLAKARSSIPPQRRKPLWIDPSCFLLAVLLWCIRQNSDRYYDTASNLDRQRRHLERKVRYIQLLTSFVLVQLRSDHTRNEVLLKPRYTSKLCLVVGLWHVAVLGMMKKILLERTPEFFES